MPPQRQLPGSRPGPAPSTGGPIHAVTCPHCGAANDLRDLQSQQLLDTGSGVTCDKCGKTSQVTQILPITFVSLRPTNKPVAHAAHMPRQATTISAGHAQQLAGGVSRRVLPRGRK